MKISDKENLIRENGSYSALVRFKSDDRSKEFSVLFEISEEFFHFKVFDGKNFTQNEIDSWWSDSEIEKLLEQNKDRIFEYRKWKCDVRQSGVNMTASSN